MSKPSTLDGYSGFDAQFALDVIEHQSKIEVEGGMMLSLRAFIVLETYKADPTPVLPSKSQQ
jgi:hypothetical protein